VSDREPPPGAAGEDAGADAREPGPEEFAVWDPDFVPPDPSEPPPVDLWRAVGDVQPWATLLVLFACSAMFLLLAARHALGENDWLIAWGANTTHLAPREAAWRLLASTFLHAGPAHLFFNATTLIIFGPAVERIFTRWGFAIVYAGGGAIASLASLAWRSTHVAGTSYGVGASGAIFGLGGALVVAAGRLRRRLAVGRARSLGAAVIYLAGTGFAAGFTRNGTDNVAHAAGIVTGAVLGALLPFDARLAGRGPATPTRVAGALAAAALGVSLAIAVAQGLRTP